MTEMLKRKDDIHRFWSKVDRRGPNECWPWMAGCFSSGYGAFSFIFRGKKVTRRAHRIALSMHDGHLGKKKALHSCDNKPCCNPAHLWGGTVLQNVADRDRKGRTARGEQSGKAKITSEQAIAIRSSTMSQRATAKAHGISKSMVGNIRRNESWTHV